MVYQGPFDGEKPNSQPIRKLIRDTTVLHVHSVFYTIQGEGPFCGMPAVFVRLAGCNLQCPLCDTEYTRGSFAADPAYLISLIRCQKAKGVHGVAATSLADDTLGGLVVITGGEPFRQPKGLALLIRILVDSGYLVQIETNGTLPPPKGVEWQIQMKAPPRGAYIVCSPKTGKVNPEVVARACCFKYVGRAGELDDDDGLPVAALAHTANPRLARPPVWWDRPVYLQPCDEQDEQATRANVDAVRNSCLRHGHQLQLQIHKHIGVE